MAASNSGVFHRIALMLLVGALAACSSAQKKKGDPELSELQGKKIALVELEGERVARSVVEVALINQLIQNGSFILISKQDVENARSTPEQNPTDWKTLARRVGADYALRGRVLEFDATDHEGYSDEKARDSQLAEERGEDEAETRRFYKVKSQEGHVKVQLEFIPLSGTQTRIGIAEYSDKEIAEAKDKAVHLSPKLRFLETIANRAFQDFFEKYR